MAPLYYPLVLWNALKIKPDKNFICNDKVNKMTGKMACCSSNELNLREIKELSKKLKVTINDLVTTSISMSIG